MIAWFLIFFRSARIDRLIYMSAKLKKKNKVVQNFSCVIVIIGHSSTVKAGNTPKTEIADEAL